MKILLRSRISRFLLGGGAATLFNLILITFLIEQAGFNTPLLRNIANLIAMELSLIYSFVIYRLWVWPNGNWSLRDMLLKQLSLYHLSTGLAVLLRGLVIFPFLDALGVNYGINTFLGVVASAVLNYVISDRLVFQQKNTEECDLYLPEGLSPTFKNVDAQKSKINVVKHNSTLHLSLVVPAYNEEKCIKSTIVTICSYLDKHNVIYDVLVINDNSKDDTRNILVSLCKDLPQVRFIDNYYPNGFGFAVRCGLENFRGDAVAIVMADASDPPEFILEYYKKLCSGYDCVFGSRFVPGGKVYDYPPYKLVLNRMANTFIKILFGINYNDTTNAFKAYRREVIDGISPLISHHFNLTVEMPIKAIIRGYSSAIIPISWYNRKTGVSKLKIKEMGSRYLFVVLYLFLEKTLSRGDYINKNSFEMTYFE